jgi:hypothetical protein
MAGLQCGQGDQEEDHANVHSRALAQALASILDSPIFGLDPKKLPFLNLEGLAHRVAVALLFVQQGECDQAGGIKTSRDHALTPLFLGIRSVMISDADCRRICRPMDFRNFPLLS